MPGDSSGDDDANSSLIWTKGLTNTKHR